MDQDYFHEDEFRGVGVGRKDDVMKQAFVEESLDHLSGMENELLRIEEDGENLDDNLVNKVFRAVHSIKGGAAFLGLSHIRDISHEMETVLGLVRSRKLVPNAEIVHFLLLASDALEALIRHIDQSEEMDISSHLEALRSIAQGMNESMEKSLPPAPSGDDDDELNDTGGAENRQQDRESSFSKDPLPLEKDFQDKAHDRDMIVRDGDGTAVFTVTAEMFENTRKENKNLFFIEIPLKGDPGIHDKAAEIIALEIAVYGSVLGRRMGAEYFPVGGRAAPGFYFLVLFASILAMDEIRVLFEVDEQFILQLTGAGGDIGERPDAVAGENTPASSKAKSVSVENIFPGAPAVAPPAINEGVVKESVVKESILKEFDPAAVMHPSGVSPSFHAAARGTTAKSSQPPSSELNTASPDPCDLVHSPGGDSAPAREHEDDALLLTPPKGKVFQPSEKNAAVSETSIRVDLCLLDTLMTLAGELVLGRNQLLQAMAHNDGHATQIVGQRIDLITSELQETVMRTRMQPMGKVFDRFPRLVRDLSAALGKKVRLTIKGGEVELDKTLLEAVTDPLIHLVRNGIDHGIEFPDDRQSRGKSRTGQISLKAFHEAGKVNIEIADDGRGLDKEQLVEQALASGHLTKERAASLSDKETLNLIFLPGFSTVANVTELSGRGVGMDVVKSNMDNIGGQVKIESQPGVGTRFLIKVPLTLAIIPSQIVMVARERFALPQLNLEELVRVPVDQVYEKIEYVGRAQVVRLRDELIPLVRLADVLGMERTFLCEKTGRVKQDQRMNIADRRSLKHRLPDTAASGLNQDFMQYVGCPRAAAPPPGQAGAEHRSAARRDRRYHAAGALNIAVVSTGTMKYGLVVDKLHDSEEIVVKPLGRHLQQCRAYAGATIMGDGRAALILDVANIADLAGITPVDIDSMQADINAASDKEQLNVEKPLSFLLFRGAPQERFAVFLDQVLRIEKISSRHMEHPGGRRVVQSRGGTLLLFSVDEAADVAPVPEGNAFLVIVCEVAGREVGLLAAGPVDAVETRDPMDKITLKQPGIAGSVSINGHTTMVVDIKEVVNKCTPRWEESGPDDSSVDVKKNGKNNDELILIVEDSGFFRNQIKVYLEAEGYQVIVAEDGRKALDLISTHIERLSLVVTDLEMPHMDGFTLTRTIRELPRYAHLPVIALSTLADDADLAKGEKAGVDAYQIKLDRDALLKSIALHIRRKNNRRKGDAIG